MTLQTENKYLTEEVTEVLGKAATRLESLRTIVKSGSFTLLNELVEVLAQFTSDYGYLSPLHQKFRAARENNEVQTYITLKKDAAVAGNKFVSAPAEKEARSSVAELLEAERMLEGYVDALEQGILSSKKIIEVQMLERQKEGK